LTPERTRLDANALDDPEALAAADPSDFLKAVEGLPAQLDEAIGLAGAVDGLPPAAGLTAIAVLGMGGSGISGELCRSVLAPLAPVPVVTIRDYDLPAWVGPDTLVFAVSYSGDTEETLSAFRQAAERGARLVAVTTGGALAREADAGGYPAVVVPGGLMPRAALGYVGVPPLVVCSRLGLAPGLASSTRTPRCSPAGRSSRSSTTTRSWVCTVRVETRRPIRPPLGSSSCAMRASIPARLAAST
jgi:glucose/mannose-6-phosphate isomerase